MEGWWNCVIELRVPFDTPEAARKAFTDDETVEALFSMFGPSSVIGGRVEEVTNED